MLRKRSLLRKRTTNSVSASESVNGRQTYSPTRTVARIDASHSGTTATRTTRSDSRESHIISHGSPPRKKNLLHGLQPFWLRRRRLWKIGEGAELDARRVDRRPHRRIRERNHFLLPLLPVA